MRTSVFVFALGAALAAPASTAADMPIFDAHVHYSHDAWDNLPPTDAIAILRKAGLEARAGVELGRRGHAAPGRRGARARDPVAAPLSHAQRRRARGCATTPWRRSSRSGCAKAATPRSASSICTARTPTCRCPRRMVALAKQYKLVLHAHSDVDAIERLFRQDPDARILWAHSGFDAPDRVRDMLRKHKNLWCDLAFRTEHGSGGKVPAEWRAVFDGVSRPLHGRHRHVHAGALALHRRARELVARVARRPAAGAGRAHRMAQRRGAVRVLEARRAVIADRAPRRRLATALVASQPAQPPRRPAAPISRAPRVLSRSAHYAVAYRRAVACRRRRAFRRRLRRVSARRRARARKPCASMRACRSTGTA